MSLLEVLQLIGYSTGAWLHLWIGALLVRGRLIVSRMEQVLFALIVSIGLWHASNLLVLLPKLLGLDLARLATALRLADTIAVLSITFSYSFLLHVHLYLWADARGRPLTFFERVRIYLSYIPTLFLTVAIPPIWGGDYAPLFEKLAHLVVPFALWAAYAMGVVALTDWLVARRSSEHNQRWFMRLLAGSFVATAVLLLAAYPLGVGRGTNINLLLQILANLGSLLPMALLVRHIYRYRYLELAIRDSLAVASLAVLVLLVYLYGVRFIGAWLTARYGLRAGAVESLMILMLALVAAPVKHWLDRRFRNLFEREATLYRDVVARISRQAAQYTRLPELLHFIEERTAQAFDLTRVQFVLHKSARSLLLNQAGGTNKSENSNGKSADTSTSLSSANDLDSNPDSESWIDELLQTAESRRAEYLENERVLREQNFAIAYVLRREERTDGLMLIDAPAERLTGDVRQVLEVFARQVAVAIEDCRLNEENVQLGRRLAEGERLAALGQMAATVAHEVKNPLSAIKSIAQVMREDVALAAEYGRDLDLIVGETNRLSQSVTQLLSFASHAPPTADVPLDAGEIIEAVVGLFRVEAQRSGILIECLITNESPKLDSRVATTLRDALSNLLLNALQATPPSGRVVVEAHRNHNDLFLQVTDTGLGIREDLRERIWEPFFTTKQRGTGLGLAIVRKRVEEASGTVRLVPNRNGTGARFELRLPIAH